MKRNLALFFLMFFMAAFARAEKSYLKDRAECALGTEKITIDLRGKELITEKPDDSYGSGIHIEHRGTIYPVSIPETIPGRYRLLRGNNELCNKPLAMKISDEEIAVFFAKDNRPFADQLFVLFYNFKGRASDFVASKITTRAGLIENGKVFFRLASSDLSAKYGTVMIGTSKYQYVEKALDPWIAFDGKNFRLDRRMTYEKFEQKKLLKEADLDALNEFRELRYTIASNPKLGRKCLSLNQIDWVCDAD